ncbi:hypothetical protein Tco_0054806, partial [Tanacetum coccineum]
GRLLSTPSKEIKRRRGVVERTKVVKAIKDKDGHLTWGNGAKQLVKTNNNGVSMGAGNNVVHGREPAAQEIGESYPHPLVHYIKQQHHLMLDLPERNLTSCI